MKNAAVCLKQSWLKKYFRSEGRASRMEFFCFTVTFSIGLAFAMLLREVVPEGMQSGAALAVPIFFLFAAAPYVTVRIRRLHDMGWSGWWIVPEFFLNYWLSAWIAKINTVGASFFAMPNLVLTFLFFLPTLLYCTVPGSVGANRFGGPETYRRDGV